MVASSLTSLRGLMLPVNLGDAGVWGGPELNAGMISILDLILGGTTTLYSSNATSVTLTASQTQAAHINCVSSAAMTVTFVGSSVGYGPYVVTTGTNGVTFQSTNGGGGTATIAANSNSQIFSDGTNVNLVSAPTVPQSSCSYEFVFDGGGSTPATNTYIFLESPFTSSLGRWTIVGQVAGTAGFEIAKCAYANFSSALTSIRGGNSVSVSAAVKNQGTISAGAGWTTTINSGDILGAYLTSVATFTRLSLSLVGQRTVS